MSPMNDFTSAGADQWTKMFGGTHYTLADYMDGVSVNHINPGGSLDMISTQGFTIDEGSYLTCKIGNWWPDSVPLVTLGIAPDDDNFAAAIIEIQNHGDGTYSMFLQDGDSTTSITDRTNVALPHHDMMVSFDFHTSTYDLAFSFNNGVDWDFHLGLGYATYEAQSHTDPVWHPEPYLSITDEVTPVNYYAFNTFTPPVPTTHVDAAPLVVQWNFETFYLRHSTRHLHKTVFDYLSTQLATLGWTVDGDVPFDAPTVRLQEELPDEWDAAKVLTPGTVALTLGDENEAKNQELGGPLALIQVPLFIDVFMDTPGTTLALALDVRDIFTGRLPGTVRFLDVYDYSPNTPAIAQGYRMEFEDVIRQNVKKNWEVVKITAMLYFPDSEGN